MIANMDAAGIKPAQITGSSFRIFIRTMSLAYEQGP